MPRCISVIMLPDSWPSLPATRTVASIVNAPKAGVSSMPPNRMPASFVLASSRLTRLATASAYIARGQPAELWPVESPTSSSTGRLPPSMSRSSYAAAAGATAGAGSVAPAAAHAQSNRRHGTLDGVAFTAQRAG